MYALCNVLYNRGKTKCSERTKGEKKTLFIPVICYDLLILKTLG